MKAVLMPLLFVVIAAFVGVYIANTVKLIVQKHKENNIKSAASPEKEDSDRKEG